MITKRTPLRYDGFLQFFSLSENAFSANLDPRYIHATPQYRSIVDELTFGITSRHGLLLVTGDVGTGKTTIINQVLLRLAERSIPTAYLFYTQLAPQQLIEMMMDDFGIACGEPGANQVKVLERW